jgi:hypothetical protein
MLTMPAAIAPEDLRVAAHASLVGTGSLRADDAPVHAGDAPVGAGVRLLGTVS